ncbi:hypothetical protein AKJ09_09005 [Labilithrix luteola]|uniref:Uncharacterized protein n=2 Tax=Labilithrix luteola TaxID=1391654 RepID=A0A0K1Q9K5_9BACT|nr:hypothetical protein AKJ09_09005 [Labilithrix luteola]
MAAAFGCSVAQEDDASTSSRVGSGGDVSAVLKSTLVLNGGCTAAKVGPKHLLVSARCISASPEIFAAGKTVSFVSGATSSATTTFAPSEETDAGSDASAGNPDTSDAGTDTTDTTDTDAATGATDSKDGDAGTPPSKSANVRTAKIASLEIATSFVAKCTDLAACGLDKTEASDSPDVALIVLSEELTSVPTIPVDLDVVNDADPVLVVSSGCSRLDARDPSKLKTLKTMAVPAKSVNHDGSPYQSSPQLVSRVKASYVVTPGSGWRKGEAALCKGDFGAPMFRAGTAAVAGVMSNVTLWSENKSIAVTVQHTRVDATSRFKIGAWLERLGAQTVHSCSETAGGCVTRSYDGGMPELSATDDTTDDGPTNALPGDGGVDGSTEADAEVGQAPSDPYQDQLPQESASDDDYGDYDYGDAAVTKKKKKTTGGCNAGSGPAPVGELSLMFGFALAGAVARRRRRA